MVEETRPSSAWRSLVDREDGREFMAPESALWEIVSREERDGVLELLLRNADGHTIVVEAVQ